jgi:DNA-directed RNA polymerase subunit H (RpoH/RPB5)
MTMGPLEHSRVPPHFLLNEKESNAVLKSLGIEITQLPGLSINDPALMAAAERQELDLIPLDRVVKIIRESPLGDTETVYYRRTIPITDRL